jgi:hypothetical protein
MSPAYIAIILLCAAAVFALLLNEPLYFVACSCLAGLCLAIWMIVSPPKLLDSAPTVLATPAQSCTAQRGAQLAPSVTAE